MPSAPRHGGHALLAALLASVLLATGAQPASPGGGSDADAGGQEDQVSTAMVALLAAVVAVFVFIAASTIYLRHCSTGRHAASSGSSPGDGRAVPSSLDAFFSSRSWWQRRGRSRPRGLDAEAVEAFPTMTYAEAKALRVGNKGGGGGDGGALECAVCLCEFEDGDRLRLLLPRCCHAFHPDCIAEWLAGHVTCPVCRCNLQPATSKDDSKEPTSFPSIPPVASSVSSETAAAWQSVGPLPVAVVIDVVTEEEEEARRQEALDLQRIGTQRRAMRRSPSGHRAATQLAARLDRDLERFTLQLPEHVRGEMVAAAAERSSHLRRGRRRRAAEGISAPLVGRMGRWQSLLGRTFSGRLSFFSASRVTGSFEGGEVSSSSSSFYTRLRGKRVAAVDATAAADVPAEGSIRLDRVGVGGSGSGAKASSEVAAAAAADEEMART